MCSFASTLLDNKPGVFVFTATGEQLERIWREVGSQPRRWSVLWTKGESRDTVVTASQPHPTGGSSLFLSVQIDIQIKDAIGRYHQCATIQLDFQLPIRFNLTFVGWAFSCLLFYFKILKSYILISLPIFFGRHDGDDKNRPVIIHRAILGSVERMIAILTENFGGKWWVVSEGIRR